MAFRIPIYWKSTVGRLLQAGKSSSFTTSTTPKTKPYAPAALDVADAHDTKPRPVKGDFVPVCLALGLIAMSATLGLYTGMHQLARAPNVRVRKSMRETIPEVVEPDLVVEEGNKFIKKSLFRQVAHIQKDPDNPFIHDFNRCELLTRQPRAETLKSVGVDPKKQ